MILADKLKAAKHWIEKVDEALKDEASEISLFISRLPKSYGGILQLFVEHLVINKSPWGR
jgi:hypothetical protein